MNEYTSAKVESEGISAPALKMFLLSLQHYWQYLKSRLWLIIIIIFIGAGIGFSISFFRKVMYIAELSFVMEDNKSNSLASYAGLASQFGLDLGGGAGNSGVFAADNILAFLQSRMMLERTLLFPVRDKNNNVVSLAELYIESYDLREQWAKEPGLERVTFPFKKSRTEFSLVQDSLLCTLFQSIIKKNLSVLKEDKKSGFIVVKCSSPDEIFSKVFTEKLVEQAVEFYINTKTRRSKTNVGRLQEQADSLEILLNQKTYTAAAVQDLNLNPARKLATVKSEVTSRDKIVLQTMYGEVVKNLELSKMAMAQETPIIQVVDTPILPLEKIGKGHMKNTFIGAMMAGFLVTFILLALKVIKDIMGN